MSARSKIKECLHEHFHTAYKEAHGSDWPLGMDGSINWRAGNSIVIVVGIGVGGGHVGHVTSRFVWHVGRVNCNCLCRAIHV